MCCAAQHSMLPPKHRGTQVHKPCCAETGALREPGCPFALQPSTIDCLTDCLEELLAPYPRALRTNHARALYIHAARRQETSAS